MRIRDTIIMQNISPIREQVAVRQEQMQAQQLAGYVIPSFDVIEICAKVGYLESLEKRVSELERKAKMMHTATSIAYLSSLEEIPVNVLGSGTDRLSSTVQEGFLERLERRIGNLQKMYQ